MPVRTRPQPIQRPRLDQDVVPFTEYRRTLNDWFARTAKTHRPVIITQNGRATNVMISIADFESTWDEIDRCREREELTRAVAISRRQFEAGECQSEGEVFDEMENNRTLIPRRQIAAEYAILFPAGWGGESPAAGAIG